MDMYEKSLLTLELPAVLELLAAEASSDAAKALCRALRPADHAGEVRRRLGVKTVHINYVGPVIGNHSGPGTMALFFLGKER